MSDCVKLVVHKGSDTVLKDKIRSRMLPYQRSLCSGERLLTNPGLQLVLHGRCHKYTIAVYNL